MWLVALVGSAYCVFFCLLCVCTPGLLLVAMNVAVLAHSLGHALAARAAGAPVLVFSAGVGPPVPGAWFIRGATLFKVSVIPVGGYVVFADDSGRGMLQRLAIRGGGIVASV